MKTPTLSPEDILVRSQETPNPLATKFIMNQLVKAEGRATFHDPQEAESIPLARDLFLIKGVKQLYFFENTLTVSHDDFPLSQAKEDFEQKVFAVIKTRLPSHNNEFISPGEEPQQKKSVDRSHLSSDLREIEEILDRTIRPGLQADGGDIEVLELIDNELRILYQGACGGCPSSMMGTLDAIQGILRHELNNDHLRVIPV